MDLKISFWGPDEEADYYNERIMHFENGDYTGTRKVDLNPIKK